MQYKRSKGYRCIKADTPEEFEKAVNEVLIEHPSAEMKIDTLIPLMCHAWFNVDRYIAENKAEKYELKGEVHYCIECPYLDRPLRSNKSQKRFPCQYAEYGISMTDSRCCDKFYEWMERNGK